MRHISDSLYELLMSQGIEAGERAGTRKLARKLRAKAGTNARGIKARSSANGDALTGSEAATAGGAQERPTGRVGERSPIYLAWSNPAAMRQGTRRKTGVPFLMIVR